MILFVIACQFICTNVRKPHYFSKWMPVNVCDAWPRCFDSSSALCSAQPPGSLSHLMKKRVDLLQVTDAENRLTQLGCTFPISCTTKASTQVVGMRGKSRSGTKEVEGSCCWKACSIYLYIYHRSCIMVGCSK